MPEHVTVLIASRFFTPDRAYGVVRWHDGAPQVRNDLGSLTWLTERHWWAPAVRPPRAHPPRQSRAARHLSVAMLPPRIQTPLRRLER